MAMPPIVYLGPTLNAAAAKKWLPGAQIMPPVRRGDLYRDRLLGFQVFLIVDGTFFQSLAVSPREVVDVIDDGALLFGAASMGALRAAECWPAGMRGIGAIYRLFRRGRLHSDDEVAVACQGEPPYRATTDALVNVRYAAATGVRRGILAPASAHRIVSAACSLHYAERTWPAILTHAGVADPDCSLAAGLGTADLKRMDATRALRQVRNALAAGAGARTSRRAPRRPGFLDVPPREAPHHPDPRSRTLRDSDLWQWMLASGVYRRYAPGPILACPNPGAAAACGSEYARTVLEVVRRSGELPGLELRCSTLAEAAALSRARRLEPRASHVRQARQDLAAAHGFGTWADLRHGFLRMPHVWRAILVHVDRVARGKRVRDALCAHPPATAFVRNPFASSGQAP